MRRAGAVALNTFREAVRDRVLYNLVFFALLMMAAAIFVGGISIGIEEMVIKSLGLSAISVIGLLIAVFIGVGLVYKEMDKRTLYALLAKPVRRWEFLLGKFGGLVLTLAVNTLAMAAGLFVALLYVKHHLESARWGAAHRDLFHSAEIDAGGGAGAAVFLLHHASAGHSVHRRRSISPDCSWKKCELFTLPRQTRGWRHCFAGSPICCRILKTSM